MADPRYPFFSKQTLDRWGAEAGIPGIGQNKYSFRNTPNPELLANIRPASDFPVQDRFTQRMRVGLPLRTGQTSTQQHRFGFGDMLSGLGQDVGLGKDVANVAAGGAGFAINPWIGAAGVAAGLGMGIWSNVNQMNAIGNQDRQFEESLQFKRDQMDRMWAASKAYGMASPFQSGPPGRVNISGSNDGFVNMGSYAT